MRINLSLLVVLLAFMQVGAAGYAQKITLKEHNASLEQIFQAIKQQSGYVFVYNTEDLKNTRISVNVKNSSIEKTMEICLEGLPFTYKIIDNNILIKAKEENILDQLIDYFNQINVKGTVSDEKGEPLPGATVRIKGTAKAVVSDAAGNFSLTNIEDNAVLVISYTGFITQEVPLNGRSELSIVLTEDLTKLNEVVVVGYGTQKKANLTGAVSSVDVDEVLGDRPVSTTGALLQGTVPGLQVSIGSGEPGAGKSFNIRGATDIGTKTSGDDANKIKSQGPFILVDNVPFNGPLNLIDPNDIEDITVLKDAGSAAIYGARSAFGVILITTKKGAKNQKTKFTYSNNLTLAAPMSMPEKATVLQTIQSYKDMGTQGYFTGHDVDTWLELIKEYTANPAAYPESYAMVGDMRYPLAATNALKNLLGDYSTQFMHNLSVSGGSEKTTYRVSVGTVKEKGLLVPEIDHDQFKRYNLKSVVTSDIKDWLNVQVDASYYNSTKITPGNDGLNNAVNFAPWVPMSDSLELGGETYVSWTPRNMVILSAPTIDRFDDIRLTGRAVLTPLKGLKVTGEYTFDNLRNLNTSYDKKITRVHPRNFELQANTGDGRFKKINEITDYKALNFFANYDRSIKDHNLSAMIGYNQEESSFEQEVMQRDGVISAEYPSISQATGVPEVDDNYREFAVYGFFGRLNYDYKEKYLLQLIGRYDASSKFPENHRSGFFPSVSLGWAMEKEGFMSGTANWLSQFKPRVSLGSVGNQNIGFYEFLPNMNASYASWLHGNAQQTSLSSPGLISSGFTWATVRTFNLGLDVAFLKNRLSANLDWFQRDTKDMLYEGIQLPSVLGVGAPLQNVADLRSEGFEIQLNWQDKIGNISYRIGANLYDYQSEITRIKNEVGILSQYYKGQQMGEIWGYTTDRLFTVDDFEPGSLDANLTGGTLKAGIPYREGQLANPGDVMFVDLDGSGIIDNGTSTLSNPGDRSIIGNSTPRYQYGINGGLTWKNLNFSFVITGTAKQDQWRANMLTFPNYHAFGTLYANLLDYWTPANTDAFWGRTYDQARGNQGINESIQTRYLLNGANLRVRNLTLGYTLPKTLTNKIQVDRLQTFLSVENAFTFDHLPKGLDSELDRDNNYGFEYPYIRSFSLGVNLSF